MPICPACSVQNRDEARFCDACGYRYPQLRTDPQRELKNVTVLYCDLVDSTLLGRRLDTETLHSVMERFYREAKQVVEWHGGAVHQVSGDRVMAVFGWPRLLGDDALRAVRAASGLHEATGRLNEELGQLWDVRLEVHSAVNTGEVLVGEGVSDPLATSADVFNVAARLEKAAPPGKVLLGRRTHLLVRNSVDTRPFASDLLKDLGEDQHAYELVDLNEPSVLPRRFSAPMIGRDLESHDLQLYYRRVVARSRCELVNVVGPTGVGKTRLVEEFMQSIPKQRGSLAPLVLRGRCLPHGSGATSYPMRQVLRQASGIRHNASNAEVRRQVANMVGEAEDSDQIIERISAYVGQAGEPAEPEDTLRALRRTLEILAGRTPVVLIIDDVHWAEPPLLDILQHVNESLTTLPILVVCVARSDFFDAFRDWVRRVPYAHPVRLEPLTRPDTEELIDQLLLGGRASDEVATAICDATEGYPLHVEELLVMLSDDKKLRLVDGHWELTASLEELDTELTVDAAIAARLDRLEPDERRVAMRASLVGNQFRVADVAALFQDLDREQVAVALRSLVRKELLQFNPGATISFDPDDESYSFRHARHQETAYERLSREDRTRLHLRYADWLDASGDERPVTIQQVAHHLERAHHFMGDARGPAARERYQLAQRAGERFAAAGRLWLRQGFFPGPTATHALEEAIKLLDEHGGPYRQALLDLADARQAARPAEAKQTYVNVLRTAKDAGDTDAERHARLGVLEMSWLEDFRGDWDNDRGAVEGMIAEFQARLTGDNARDESLNVTIAKAYRLLANAHFAVGRTTDALTAVRQARQVAELTSDERLGANILRLLCVIQFWGPNPLEEVRVEVNSAIDTARKKGFYSLEAGALSVLARVGAMQGEFDRARRRYEQAKRLIRDPGDRLTAGVEVLTAGQIELLAGKPERAADLLASGYEVLKESRSTSTLLSVTPLLARVMLLLGREREAEEYISECKQGLATAHLEPDIKWRSLNALLLSRRDRHEEAEEMAREALTFAERSEQPDTRAWAFADLAEVLERAGRPLDAMKPAREALKLYRQKGNKVMERRTNQWVARLQSASRLIDPPPHGVSA